MTVLAKMVEEYLKLFSEVGLTCFEDVLGERDQNETMLVKRRVYHEWEQGYEVFLSSVHVDWLPVLILRLHYIETLLTEA